ncbi:hypothetical protein PUN28_000762 [Cardiocondyla obscurior]|uniref:Uncharacterized protein n=1 Tax=Cardiocondyla obscurior TaxID=286306 RepID=A0AAW2H0W8_9HYME
MLNPETGEYVAVAVQNTHTYSSSPRIINNKAAWIKIKNNPEYCHRKKKGRKEGRKEGRKDERMDGRTLT